MKILGLDWRLEAKDKNDIDCFGRTAEDELLIQVATTVYGQPLAPQQLENTVLHEALHCVDEALRLELGEEKVCRLEASLSQVLRDAGVDLAPLTRELRKASSTMQRGRAR